jgi:hypothetical protein
MARTKQTARKSVGSKVPRKNLYITHRVARKSAPLNITTGFKKVRVYKPGSTALKEIKKYQRNVLKLFFFEEYFFSFLFLIFNYLDRSFDSKITIYETCKINSSEL